MLSSLYRPLLQGLLGDLVKPTYTIDNVLVLSQHINISLSNIEVSSRGCEYLNSFTSPLRVRNVLIQHLVITCESVYFIPYKLRIQISGAVIELAHEEHPSPSSSWRSSQETYDSSSASGVILTWINDCFHSLSLEIRDVSVHLSSWNITFNRLTILPRSHAVSTIHKEIHFTGLRIKLEQEDVISIESEMAIYIDVLSSSDGYHLHHLSILCPEVMRCHCSLVSLNQVMTLMQSLQHSPHSTSPLTRMMDQETLALFEAFIQDTDIKNQQTVHSIFTEQTFTERVSLHFYWK